MPTRAEPTSRPPTRTRGHAASARFEHQTVELVTQIRDLFTQLVAIIRPTVTTASEFQRATRLDMKLCWKVFRVISAADGLSAAQYVPGPANIRDLLKTLKRLGAPDTLIRKTERAAEAFEQLVREHAEDRRTFDSMVCGFAGPQSDKIDIRQRRAAFQACTHIWGVQADAMIMTLIQRPASSHAGRLDELGMRSDLGLRRLRPTPMPLYELRYSAVDHAAKEYTEGRREALSGDGSGLGLISEFSSRPLPELSIKTEPDGRSLATLVHGELGMRAAVDLVTGCVLRSWAPRFRGGGGETHSWSTMQIARPCRVGIVDLIVEPGVVAPGSPPRGFMSTRSHLVPPIQDLWTEGQLSDGEPVARLGRGPAMLSTPEAPRYAESIDWAIRRAGWDPERFETWRLRVDFPVALATIGLVYEMPEA